MDDDDARGLRVADARRLQFLAFPENFPAPGAMGINAGKHFHQRGFARAVLTAKADTLARAHFQVNSVKRFHAVEVLTDIAHL